MDVLAAAYENARPEVVARVPVTARRVLDLGCSSGALGAALKARQGCEVVGVELDAAYADRARERLDQVVCGDLAEIDLEALGSFDCVVAADVLEHLVDPWAVLGRATALLGPGDAVVVSLPNVRYWETFWQVGVKGTFPKRSLGTFDKTHLRWFTLADAYDLLDVAGCEVTEVDRLLRFSPIGPVRTGRLLQRLPGRTFLTYQHVLAARRRA